MVHRFTILALLVLAACTPRGADVTSEDLGGRPRGGVPAASLAPEEQPLPVAGAEPGAPAGEVPPDPEVAADTPAAERTFRLVGEVNDPRGDVGADAPPYADLLTVLVHDDDDRARVSVDVAADLPARLADGEVLGIGVDLFGEPEARESDYQLFADGGADGWTAYLQTPRGFVDYPGSFRVGGRRLVFEVPWSSLGNPETGAFTAFSDWSQRRPVLNATGSDRAPDSGRGTFNR